MRKKKQTIGLLTLAVCFGTLAGCSQNTSSSTTDSSSSSSSSTSSTTTSPSTDNWTPGENADPDAEQPEFPKPTGRHSALNTLRQTQGDVGFPTLGEANLLVVPVLFSDSESTNSGFEDLMLDYVKDAFFGTDTEIPSVETFINASSNGMLQLAGVVAPTITLSESTSEALATATNSVQTFLDEITAEVYDALFVDDTRCYDPADFDADGNGSIDGIFLVNPLVNSMLSEDQTLAAISTDYTVMGSRLSSPVDSMSYASVYDALLSLLFRQSQSADSHLFLNSLGMMMGLETYVDSVGNETTQTLRAPLALTDRMDGIVGDHNPFSKYQMGWLTPTFVTAEDVPADGKEVTVSAESPIALSYDDCGLYGEYLLIDVFDPTSVANAFDSTHMSYLTGRSLFNEAAVRVYEVDSTLVYGDGSGFYPTSAEPETDSGRVYSYRHSNDSVNPLSDEGIIDAEPLLSLLSESGRNRHILDSNVALTNDDLFAAGDSFGEKEGYDFYKDFAFDSGKKLGLTFEVKSIEDGQATILIRRAQ